MPALLIDGKAVSERRRTALTERVRALQARGVQPCLAAITVRPDGGWSVYQKGQASACAQVGVVHRQVTLGDGSGAGTTADLLELIEALNVDPQVHGIICQNPLPSGFDPFAVAARISPDKDVEGLGPANLGLVLAGRPGLAPCTALSAVALAQEGFGLLASNVGAGEALKGVEAVVIGASTIVGKPVASLLTAAGATVTLCQITTRDVAAHARRADLLVVAVGKAGLVQADWVKPGAVVVDVGINRVPGPDGKTITVGDVDPAVAGVAGALTPVPGGVGAVTTTILLESTVAAAGRLADAPNAIDGASVARLLGGLDLPAESRERIALLLSRHLPAMAASATGAAAPGGTPLMRRLAASVAEGGALVLDGAMGSELIARGIAPDAVCRANREHPDLVLEIHRASLSAGAQALTTNTFRCHRFAVPDRDELARLIAGGVRLARQAAAGGRGAFILGSLGPLGPVVGADLESAAASDAYAEAALALADAQVDGLILETMPSTAEAVAALAGARRVCPLPVIACRFFVRHDEDELADFARAMETGGAAAIGVNCAGGPRATRALAAALAARTRLPVCARPNAGHPAPDAAGRPVYHLKPAYFRAQAEAALTEGIALIGGCCGVGPAHIAAIAELAGRRIGRPEASGIRPATAVAATRTTCTSAPALLPGIAFPLIALLPGRLPGSQALAAFTALAAAGIDAVGLSTGWPGSPRGGRLVAQLRAVQDATGKPGVLELAGDLGLAEAEEKLLAADLLGLGTVLIDAGLFGPTVSASSSNCDSLRLLWLIRQLNQGRNRAGNRLERATAFVAGVRLPTRDERVGEYLAAGAAFLTLQPVYDPAVFRTRMAALADVPVPVLAEVLLLPDAATAEELDNELPALAVPDALLSRLAHDPEDDARGVVRFLSAWRTPRPGFARLAGVILNLPDGRTDHALRVLKAVRPARPGRTHS